MGNSQAALVTVVALVTIVTFVTKVTLINMVTWGIPSHPDTSDVTSAICKGQTSDSENVPELLC
jgi:hypothetical protein